MNIARQIFGILVGVRYLPQTSTVRGLRKPRNRSNESENIGIRTSVISPLQVPLTEEELLRMSGDGPLFKDYNEAKVNVKKVEEAKVNVKKVEEAKVERKKGKSLKERIQPEVNPPLTEPITTENQHEKLAAVVTPLCQIPYERQLRIKEKNVQDFMKLLGHRLAAIKAPITRLQKGLPCLVEPLRPSPELVGYRNKDEFGIHFGVDRNPKTVGFFVGKPTDPLMACVPATYLINIKESHKHIAERFQTFIRQSRHEVCHRFDMYGIWRNLLVRSTRTNQKMATVYIHPQDLTDDGILEIMGDLETFFFHGEGADCELDSLYLQACRHTRCTREKAPYRLIRGDPHITEMCDGRSFHISPDSFFQINTSGAEVLYRTVREIAEVSPLTTLLDVCCGTGTISLLMAPHVRGTIGIDSTTGAIEDAEQNAILNGVSNAQFIAGSAEEVLPQLTSDLNKSCTEVVAILNPARAGFRADVIKAIRDCEAINKLVYVSCKQVGIPMENFVQLASIKGKKMRYKLPPFIPKYVVPVDMFPHTHHTEVVMLFERVSM